MLRNLRDVPLQGKIIRLTLLAIAATLLLTTLALVVFEHTTYQPRVEGELAGIVELAAANMDAALRFEDTRAARENLATLRATPSVDLAAVYDIQGELFAHYLAGTAEPPPATLPFGAKPWVSGGSMHAVRAISEGDETVGHLYISYRMVPLNKRLPAYAIMLITVAGALVALGVVLTRSLGRHVTGPILDLAETARAISDDREVRFKTEDASADEIGQLAGAFSDMHNALRERERELRRLLESMHEGLILITPDEKISFANDAFARILGRSSEEVLEQPIVSFLDDENIAKLRPALAGRDARVELRWRSSGAEVITDVTLQEVRDEDGSLRGRLCVLTDISERRSLAAQLQQSQKMEAVGRLAGGVAHDFNNLLCAINGFAEMAQLANETGEDVGSYMNEILKAGQRAAALTGQLLAFSRKQVLTMEAVSLPQLTEDLRDILQRVIGERYTVALRCDTDVGFVRADHTQIEQILVNLAVNARDAMPDGGKLTIMVRNASESADFARKFPDANAEEFACIIVSDTGSGMSNDLLDQIFDPFFTTKARGKGTGLGLSTTYGIIQQHSGLIGVDSEPGQGTTFTVCLPLTDERPPEDSPGASPAHSGNGERILVVEDDPNVRRYVINALKGLGYTLLEADGPLAAQRIFANHAATIDLLLTDVVMPEMSGPELAKMLTAERPDIPVLFMSGYTDDALTNHGILDPDIHLLQKPFTREELDDAVASILARLRHEAE
ncbi:MAG: PAS domain S-box-containing protein [Rhodothermales bacterium]|jgi:PAS domain S-box-containing protein